MESKLNKVLDYVLANEAYDFAEQVKENDLLTSVPDVTEAEKHAFQEWDESSLSSRNQIHFESLLNKMEKSGFSHVYSCAWLLKK